MDSQQTQTGEAGEDVGLLDLLIVLARQKRLVVGFPVATAVVAAVISFLLPNSYTATTKILPPQQSQSSTFALLGQLGTFGPLGQLGGTALGLKNPSDVFVAMLKSRTVADALIQRFDLKRLYDEEYLEDTRKDLESRRSISVSRDGVISIDVDDRNPKRAADLANAHVEELEKLTLDLAVSEASQRRLFFEKQLKKAKDDLSEAEVSLKTFQERSGLIKPQDQAELTVSASASLRAQITAKEVQLTAMQAFATNENPDIVRARQEVAALKSQLARIEKEPSQGPGDLVVSIGRVPETGLEYLKKFRDVKYYESLFGLLAKQYEIARIDEAKNATLIQVLDRAIPPEKASHPKKIAIIGISSGVAFLLAILGALFRETLERSNAERSVSKQIDELTRYLRSRWW